MPTAQVTPAKTRLLPQRRTRPSRRTAAACLPPRRRRRRPATTTARPPQLRRPLGQLEPPVGPPAFRTQRWAVPSARRATPLLNAPSRRRSAAALSPQRCELGGPRTLATVLPATTTTRPGAARVPQPGLRQRVVTDIKGSVVELLHFCAAEAAVLPRLSRASALAATFVILRDRIPRSRRWSFRQSCMAALPRVGSKGRNPRSAVGRLHDCAPAKRLKGSSSA